MKTLEGDVTNGPSETAAALVAAELYTESETHQFTPDLEDTAEVVVLEVSSGRRLEDLTEKLDARRQRPRVLQQQVTFHDLPSFLTYLQDFGDESATRVFLKVPTGQVPTLLGILDYHREHDVAGWKRHWIALPLAASAEWQRWSKPQQLDQAQFAEFIEDHAADLVESTEGTELHALALRLGLRLGAPADVLSAARNLHVTRTMSVHNAVTLADGTSQIAYVQENTRESVAVPGLFAVAVPVFDRGVAFRLGVRLRYRTEGGKIVWSLLPYRADDVREAALARVAAQVEEETGWKVLLGSPA